MSSRRWSWLPIAAFAALALGALVGRPGPSGEREPGLPRTLLVAAHPAAKRVGERTVIRGEVVKASLSGQLPLDYFFFVPKSAPRDAPLLVVIHGISRNAREQAESFASPAVRHGFSVVAPLFEKDDYVDYQRLGRRGRGPRADAALGRLLDELERRGVSTREVFLFGYSGGGQFVHRYVMAHPERVRAGIAASAGWYTFPDPSIEYPYGIRLEAELPGVRLRPNDFLRVPMLVVVGDADRDRDESLRKSSALDRQQGRTRVERAKRWVRAMKAAAKARKMRPRVELALIEGAGHSFEENMEAGLGDLVVEYLTRWRSPLEKSGIAERASELATLGSRWCAAGAC